MAGDSYDITLSIYIYIYTSTAKGAPLCFWKLISLRGPTTGTLIPKVIPTVKNICAGYSKIYL